MQRNNERTKEIIERQNLKNYKINKMSNKNRESCNVKMKYTQKI